MSAERLARLLVGHDATTLLEAASTVPDDVENDRFDALLARLSVNDQRTLRTWMARARAEGAEIAGTPVHPLSVLAATTLALGQAGEGPRSDETRDDLSRRLVEAALRFNVDVLEGPGRGDDAIAAYVARSTLWRGGGTRGLDDLER